MKSESTATIHDTDTFGRGAFPAHGNWRFWAEGDVVYSTARGPFNVEFVQAMSSARKESWEKTQFTRRPVHIVQIEHSIMVTQEMLVAYQTLHAQLPPERGAAAVAFVVAQDVEGRDFVLPLFEKIYRELKRNFRAFDNLPEAEAWARSHLV